MKKFRKASFYLKLAIASLVVMAIFSACKKDFLNRDPQGQYTTANYPYPKGSGPFDGQVFAAYAALRAYGIAAFPMVGATSIRSDDADKGSTPQDGPDQKQMDEFPVSPSNGLVNSLWTDHYTAIRRCNEALSAIKNDKDPANASFKSQAEGETKFLRAFNYFMLVRYFGGVPLIDSVTAISASNIPKSTSAQVYNLIENDLQFAASNLPLTYPSQFIGRITSGAANGLLAKVYLTRGNWAMAMSRAGMVINSGVYDLSTAYTEIFRETGENSKESLFEIQAIATAANPETTDYGVQYTNVQGVRGTGQFDLGWGFNVPNKNLSGAYEANDPRKDRTFLDAGETTYYNETLPTSLPNPSYNEKVYTNPAVRAQVGNRFGWWMNVRILRYADVLLMYAEAANELGGTTNTTDALTKLNMVRARARQGAPAGTLPAIVTTDQAMLRSAIRQERRVELAMEHDRFFDLVRWGNAASVLAAAGRPNFNPLRDQLLPIPQTQIDISGGVLTQNPNY